MWTRKSKNKAITIPAAAAGLGLIAGAAAYITTKKHGHQPLEVVPKVDLERYSGEWYEIARFPMFFENNCYKPKARYTLNEDGTMHVVNTCYKNGVNGKMIKAEATATVTDPSTNARLKLKFNKFPFITGDYEIIDLGSNYEYAMVGTSNRKYLWILSRAPQLDVQLIKDLLYKASELGFDTSKVIFNRQESW